MEIDFSAFGVRPPDWQNDDGRMNHFAWIIGYSPNDKKPAWASISIDRDGANIGEKLRLAKRRARRFVLGKAGAEYYGFGGVESR